MTVLFKRHSFADIHGFETHCQEIPPDYKYLQVGRGPLTIHHDILDLGHVVLRRYQTNKRVLENLSIDREWTTFCFTPPIDKMVVANGINCPANTMSITRPNVEVEVLTQAGFRSIEVDIDNALLSAENLLPLSTQGQRNSNRLLLTQLPETLSRGLWYEFTALLTNSSFDESATPKPDTLTSIRQQILALVKTAIDGGWQELSGHYTLPRAHMQRTVSRARRILENHLYAPPKMSELANEIGVSHRALQRSFISVIGISPKRYVLAKKLDVARREIIAHPGCKVLDIAHKFGFISSSRFVEQYNSHFGHTPASVVAR